MNRRQFLAGSGVAAATTTAGCVTSAFDDLEIPDENVEEGRFRVHPRRGRDGETDGYEGRHSFELTIDDVDRVGELIDELTAAGADDVGRVAFSLQDETRDEIRNEAIDDALANTDDEARHVADNRGVTITETKSVETGDVRLDTVYLDSGEVAEDDAAGRPPTEIDADPVSVTASVTVTYGFE